MKTALAGLVMLGAAFGVACEKSVPVVGRVGSGNAVTASEPQGARDAIAWERSEPSAGQRAKAERRPLLVYFTAVWCAACAELEHGPLQERRVIDATSRFVSVLIDATNDEDPAVAAVKAKYRVVGLPTLVVLDAAGHEARRFSEFVDADVLSAALRAVP